MTDEPCGGDPPCWSHLFEEGPDLPRERGVESGPDVQGVCGSDTDETGPEDLVAVSQSFLGRGPAWTRRSEDLDVNLLVFRAGEGVAEHVNDDVDVLLVGIEGEGVVTIDGRPQPLARGQAILVRKGARRGIRAQEERFSYLTCHRRRAGLRPIRSLRRQR